jgi:hypothetical protein
MPDVQIQSLVPSRQKSGGILSWINLEMYDVGSFSEGEYTLQLTLWDKKNKTQWNFINVYGAAQEEHKNNFLAELARVINNSTYPCVVISTS